MNVNPEDVQQVVKSQVHKKVVSVQISYISIPLYLLTKKLRILQSRMEKDTAVISAFIEKKIDVSDSEDSQALFLSSLDKALEKLQALYDFIEQLSGECEIILRNLCKRSRLFENESDSIDIYKNPDSFDFQSFSIIHEFLCRRRFCQTAHALRDSINLHDFVDPSVYEEACDISTELKNGTTDRFFEWCQVHKPKLSVVAPALVFEGHLQKAIDIFQNGSKMEALAYLRKEAVSGLDILSKEICGVVASMIFGYAPPVQYQTLFSKNRWEVLVEKFNSAVARVYGFPNVTMLELLFQAGYSSLKSEMCKNHISPNCPSCLPEVQEYLKQLPSTSKVSSVLICPITGELMTDKNPPMVTPDGYVYSEAGIRQKRTLTEANQYEFTCPHTNHSFPVNDFKKLYVT